LDNIYDKSLLNMNKYCKCGESVHPIRIKYGYSTCVSCSNIEAVACAPLTHHKTGNTIQIVSQAQSAALIKAGSRKGYGTCLK